MTSAFDGVYLPARPGGGASPGPMPSYCRAGGGGSRQAAKPGRAPRSGGAVTDGLLTSTGALPGKSPRVGRRFRFPGGPFRVGV